MGFWSRVGLKFTGTIPDVWGSELSKDLRLRSFTGIMLVNSIEIRKRNKALKWAVRQLRRNYTPKAVEKIYNKFATDASKTSFWDRVRLWRYQRNLKKFINNFLDVYSVFRKYFVDVLALISQVLKSGEREEYVELSDLDNVMRGLYPKVDQLIFPKGEAQRFRKQMAKVIKDLDKELHKDAQSATRVARGGHPAGAGIFSSVRWKSSGRLLRSEIKQVVKMNYNLAFYRKILNTINEELVSGIRQDLLFLLIEVFKRTDIIEKRYEDVKTDLGEILERLQKEVNQVNQIVEKIFDLFKNDPNIKPEIEARKAEMTKLRNLIAAIARSQYKNTEALLKKLKDFSNDSNEIMVVIQQKAVA